MYYSYVEIEYIAMSFSPARTDLAVKLFKATKTSNWIYVIIIVIIITKCNTAFIVGTIIDVRHVWNLLKIKDYKKLWVDANSWIHILYEFSEYWNSWILILYEFSEYQIYHEFI